MAAQLSDGEQNVLRALGMDKWIMHVEEHGVNPPKMWDIVALELFRDGRESAAVEAVRRIQRALQSCQPYRNTPEWEALCSMDSPPARTP